MTIQTNQAALAYLICVISSKCFICCSIKVSEMVKEIKVLSYLLSVSENVVFYYLCSHLRAKKGYQSIFIASNTN